MRRVWAMLFLLAAFCLRAPDARAEARILRYGGSAADALTEIAVGADGRMLLTGYTSSTDGTLSDRTKTGRSGWALCVDAQGNKLWSFCTREREHDLLTAPVLHGDGSATVLLEYEGSSRMGFELIRLSAQGEETGRVGLTEKLGTAHVTDTGYALSLLGADEPPEWNEAEGRWSGAPPLLFGWDGALQGERAEWAGRLSLTAGRFSLELRDGEEWVCRRDDGGAYAPFARVPGSVWKAGEQARLLANALLPLDDGGVALAGGQRNGAGQYDGRIARWDAQGKPVFDMILPDWQLSGLARAGDGFAATAFKVEGHGDAEAWRLVFFNAQGIVGRTVELPPAGGQQMPVVSLPDGTLALLPACPPGVESFDDDPCLVLLDPNGSETAVPAPQAAREAVFYVNPDGGKYYHTVSECPSVNKAYYPLTPMSPQEIWKAGRYSPCPVCEAWTL